MKEVSFNLRYGHEIKMKDLSRVVEQQTGSIVMINFL